MSDVGSAASTPSERSAALLDATLIPGLTAAQQERLTMILEEIMLRLEHGESAHASAFVRQDPELSEHITRYVGSLKFLQNAAGGFDRPQATPDMPREHSQLGDYLLIRTIGRGGMGVVYEAEQQSLKRRVALKVIQSDITRSPQQLQRFQREAESAANLHHTNIVPVFGIGQEDGVHYYAMQFIDGLPLTDVITQLRADRQPVPKPIAGDSTFAGNINDSHAVFPAEGSQHSLPSHEARAVTLITAAQAEGVQSAESKLSNELNEQQRKTPTAAPQVTAHPTAFVEPLLGQPNSPSYFSNVARLGVQVAEALSYAHEHGILHRDIKPSNLMLDRSGTVWIADFGLVKTADDDGLTKTGDVLGTVRYMAPEQLEGQADVTSDLYSFGLTLFEMLTLRPAFEGDQHATLHQRLKQRDVPRLRSVNPAIPRDLETIVLKATARDREARYPTAAALADDLQRFVDDRPIRARRVFLWERAWRWSRHNPALATAMGTVAVLLVVIATGSHLARLDLAEALGKAETAQQRAETNLDLAVAAFDSILNNVTLRGVPQSLAVDVPSTEAAAVLSTLSDADAQLLDQMLDFYRRFATKNSDNVHLAEKIAEAHRRAGAIQLRLGRLAEAQEAFESSLALLKGLIADHPLRTDLIALSASMHNDLGELALRRGEFRNAFNEHLEARASLLELPDADRADEAVRFELARATDLFASIDVRSGTRDVSFGPANRRNPRDTTDRDARRSPPPDRPESSPPPVEENRPANRGLASELPDRLRRALPSTMQPDSEDRDPIRGLDNLLSASATQFRSLAEEHPENIEYKFRLTQCLRHRLVHTSVTGHPEQASSAFAEAVQILEQLVERSPYEPRRVFELADTLTHASRASLPPTQTAQHLSKAVQLAERLSSRFPHISEYQLLLGVALARRAAVWETSPDIDAATKDLTLSITTLEQLADQYSDQGIIQIPLAQTRQQLADQLRSTSTSAAVNTENLQRSRELLDTAINDFESYLAQAKAQSDFNYRTRASLYRSSVQTLIALQLTEEAEAARIKSRDPRRGTRLRDPVD